MEIPANELAKYVGAAPVDPRFPLFKHLFEIHKWDTALAFNHVNACLQTGTLESPCPKCGLIILSNVGSKPN